MKLLAIFLLVSAAAFAQVANQFVALSANGKYLWNSIANEPVFLTGDAPQIAIEQLSNADAATYLADRAQRGFNALWVYPVDRVDQSNPQKDFYGNDPWGGSADFTNENSTYWARVDSFLTAAEGYGITLFLDPGFVGLTSGQGYYLNSWDSASDAALKAYADFLGNRYKSYPNVVWALGGDADPSTVSYTKLGTFAAELAAADPNHLMTLEACRACSPANQSTYDAYAASPPAFMNLNWVYNTESTVVAGCQAGYSHKSVILPMMGEDWYELEHSMTGFQIRQEGYWEILSGCYLGRLFGNGAIWSFDSPNGSACCTSGTPAWQGQLASTGSIGQQYLGLLMRSREHWLMVPDTTNAVLTGGIGSGSTLSVCACTSDGLTCIVYDSTGNSNAPQIAMSHFSGTVHAWWYNPQTGATTDLGTFTNSGTDTFTPPDGNDCALILDLASANIPAPGVLRTGSVATIGLF